MLIGAVGVLLVAGVPDARQTSTIDLFGAMLMLAAVFCCAVYTVISRNIAPGVDPLLAAAVQQTAGLAWALVLLPLEARGGVATHLAAIPGALVVVSVIAGLLYYAAAYWLYLSALKAVPAAVAGSFFNVIPVIGIVLAFAFLDERLSALQWVGAATIMMSVLILLQGGSGSASDESRGKAAIRRRAADV